MKLRFIVVGTIISLFLLTGCASKGKLGKRNDDIRNSIQETNYYDLFTRATKHALFGNNKTAIPLYETCIREYPERAAPYYQLSSIYLRQNEPDKALSYALMAYNLDPSNRWYKEHVANIYQYQEKYDEAIKIYLEILEEHPDDELVYNISTLYAKEGKYQESLDILDKLDDESKNSYEVLMLKHQDYHNMGEYDSAVAELETLVDAFSESVDSYGILAEYLSEIGRLSYAEDVYREILNKDTTNGLVYLSFAEFYLKQNEADSAFVYLSKGFCCSDMTMEDKLSTIIRLIENPEFSQQHEGQILQLIEYMGKEEKKFSYYAAKSDLYMNLGNLELAKPNLDSVLIYEKENYLVWEQTIRVNTALGLFDQVKDICGEALKYFPEEPNIYILRANSLMNENEYKDAIPDLEAALELDVDDVQKMQIFNMLAESYRNLGNNEESDTYFEKILEIDENNLIVRNNFAYYLSLRGERLEYAEKLSRYTIEKEPDNATYLDTYGWVLFRMGKIADAKHYVEEAIRNGSGRNPEVLEHYGDIMSALDRCRDALEAYETALEYGESESVESKIDKLIPNCK